MSIPGSEDSAASRPVFITGAGSGIGRAAAILLAGRDYPVFAAARKRTHLEELGRVENITPISLDVRDLSQVVAALGTVRAAGKGLHALINNAGVGGIGPIAAFTDDEVRDLFEVNVLGVFRMTREFLPLLLESAGRVILVGSQGGSISMKYYAPYTMTKHALEAFAVALDAEIRPQGARVSIVQPGAVRTAIGDNSLESDRDRFRRAASPFESEARPMPGLEDESEFDPHQPESVSNRNPSPPEAVAEAILEALEAPDPPLRTLVGTRWEGDRVLNTLMERIAQANDCPSLRYSQSELFERLAGFLERQKP